MSYTVLLRRRYTARVADETSASHEESRSGTALGQIRIGMRHKFTHQLAHFTDFDPKYRLSTPSSKRFVDNIIRELRKRHSPHIVFAISDNEWFILVQSKRKACSVAPVLNQQMPSLSLSRPKEVGFSRFSLKCSAVMLIFTSVGAERRTFPR